MRAHILFGSRVRTCLYHILSHGLGLLSITRRLRLLPDLKPLLSLTRGIVKSLVQPVTRFSLKLYLPIIILWLYMPVCSKDQSSTLSLWLVTETLLDIITCPIHLGFCFDCSTEQHHITLTVPLTTPHCLSIPTDLEAKKQKNNQTGIHENKPKSCVHTGLKLLICFNYYSYILAWVVATLSLTSMEQKHPKDLKHSPLQHHSV